MKNQKGFSLIELMVVVGIIGILAAIAVPNYQRFQAKSRQSEAKANLSALYTAQKAFFAEWNRYFSDFRHVGFAPEGYLRYRVGFSGPGTGVPANFGYTGPGCGNPTAACNAAQFATNVYCPALGGNSGLFCSEAIVPVSAAALPTATVDTATSFTAAASGNVDQDDDPDQWTINHQKLLTNTTSDLLN